MSLPSQSSRSARSSAVHYRRSSNSPIRKLLPAVLVVGALALIFWFALIKPKSTTAEEAAQQNTQELASSGSDQPIELSNSAPSRTLPGSGDRPNTQEEIQNTLSSNQPTNQPITQPITRPLNQPQTNTPSNSPQNNPNSDPSSLLDATRNQTNQTTQPIQQPANQPSSTANGADRLRLQLDTAQRMIDQNDRVAARRLLSQTLNTRDLSKRDAQRLRSELTAINDVLLFGPVVAPNDPICEEYKVQSGDSLSRIASRRELATHWKLIQRVNNIANPSRIRLGQTLKLVRGPFHAIVHKHDHRMDLYHGSPNDPAGWVYIRSFNVGLGEDNGTPVGLFTISTNKLENPGWVNPRDASERYSPDDPRNPIGEYWLGLDGVGEYRSLTGYGIHGTIDPESIGGDQSMGCVRLADDDIAMVYELLAERVSVVEIRP